MITRREAIKTTAVAAAATALTPSLVAQTNITPSAAAVPFALPALPYAMDALEPHIDARTMEIHHDRHHKAYVDNLNKAVAEMPHDKMISLGNLLKTLDSAPERVRAAVRNNGGGHYNHSLFWQMLKKNGGGGLGQAVTVFAPMLLKAGMSEAMLKSILVDNSRAFLAFTPASA